MNFRNSLVIYHANCADGFSGAWCFHNIGKIYDFHEGVYSQPPPEDIAGRRVYLVDFSYSRTVVEGMLKAGAIIWHIDHHLTAMKDLAGLEKEYSTFRSYTDLNRSGAMLAWDFLHNIELDDAEEIALEVKPGNSMYYAPPLLLDHIQDRDLWKFKLPNTRAISTSVFSHEYTFDNWDKLMSSDSVALLQLTTAGAAIERKHHKDIAEFIKVCKRLVNIGGMIVPVASIPHAFRSDAGHAMAKDYLNGEYFAACYWDTETHRVFSLRSTEDGLNVATVAQGYGGGGHKNAAGFSVRRNHPLASI